MQLVCWWSNVEWVSGKFGCWDDLSIGKDEFLPRWLTGAGAWVVAGAYARCSCAVGNGGGDAPCGDAVFEFIVVDANCVYSRRGGWF